MTLDITDTMEHTVLMFTLPNLPYDYKALEPYIDEETMHLHHDKHHAAYVNNLNEALKDHQQFSNLTIEQLLEDLNKIPEDIRAKVRNNGGGHANHSLFWQIMTPQADKEPVGKLADLIKENFGDFGAFQEKFSDLALKHFGSGWAWLVLNGYDLEIMDTSNQDNPLSTGKTPILGLDVWEHAYYLKYQNRRLEYIKAWWQVVNWPQAAKNFLTAVKSG